MKKLFPMIGLTLLCSSAFAEGATAAARRSAFAIPGGYIIMLAILALITAFAVVGSMQAKLKTASRRQSAENYVREDSFDLKVKQDCFLYKDIERKKIEQNPEKKED
jgi:hypothetical protein